MATPISLDARLQITRLARIIARQVRYLGKKQLTPDGLSLDDMRSFKIVADALDDQIKLTRLLDSDLREKLEDLPDDKLEEIAKSAPSAPESPPHPPAALPRPTKNKPRSTRAPRSSKR